MFKCGLQSRAAYTPFRAAYNERQLTIKLIRQVHNRLLEKAKEDVANQ